MPAEGLISGTALRLAIAQRKKKEQKMKKRTAYNPDEDFNYEREREEALAEAIVWGEGGNEEDWDLWEPPSTSD